MEEIKKLHHRIINERSVDMFMYVLSVL